MPRLFAGRLFGPQALSGGSGTIPDPPLLHVNDAANGGGATATISGATVGTTNTVYAQTYDPALLPLSWRSVGSRVSDGAVSFSLPLGHYAFYATSAIDGNQAVSNVTYGAITDAARQSVLWQCLLAAQVRVWALNLPALAKQSVVVQELPWSRPFDGDDPRLPLPGVIVCPIDRERMDALAGTNFRDQVEYPILIAPIARNNEQELRTNLPRYTLWRQSIVRAFRPSRLPGVREAYDMAIDPGLIVAPDAFSRQFWHSPIVVRVKTREVRGLGA